MDWNEGTKRIYQWDEFKHQKLQYKKWVINWLNKIYLDEHLAMFGVEADCSFWMELYTTWLRVTNLSAVMIQQKYPL